MDRGGFVPETVRGAGLGPDKEPSVSRAVPPARRNRPPSVPGAQPLGAPHPAGTDGLHPASLGLGQLKPSPLLGGCRACWLPLAVSRVRPEDAAQAWAPTARSLVGFSRLAGGVLELTPWALGWSRPTWPPRPSGGHPSAPSALVRPGRLVRRASLTLSSQARPSESLWAGVPASGPQPPPSSLSELQLWSRAQGASGLCPLSSQCVQSLLDPRSWPPRPAMPSAVPTAKLHLGNTSAQISVPSEDCP